VTASGLREHPPNTLIIDRHSHCLRSLEDMTMFRRLVRAFLDSGVFAFLTQSHLAWSIIRLTPRSVREYVKGVCHSVLHTPDVSIPVSQLQNENWRKGTHLISVIIPCYNYGEYLRDALESIRAQTIQDFEVIVVDDGSTDELTLDVLNGMRQEGVRVRTQEHSGPAQTLNSGISQARGKYVCCLSADDTIEPTYLEKCVVLLESNPGISFAYSLVKTFGLERRVGLTRPFDLRLLLAYNHVCGSAVFLRDAWKAVGGFDTAMPAYEDWDFWIRLGESGFRGKLIPEPLFNWRRHPQAFGTIVDKKRPELLAKMRSNHADLFSDLERIESIQKNYRDYRVLNPFLNLASEEQYFQFSRPVGLVLVSEPPHLPDRVYDSLSELREKGATLISVITGGSSELSPKLHTVSSSTYNLATFLEQYYWRDFVINLIRTRAIQFTLICNSKLGYELSPLIKTKTSCTIVDTIESEEFKSFCLKFNSSHSSY